MLLLDITGLGAGAFQYPFSERNVFIILWPVVFFLIVMLEKFSVAK